MGQRDWLQESAAVWPAQPPVHGWLHQQKLQGVTTTKSQDENSTNHLLLHPWVIKAGCWLTRKYLILFFFLNPWLTCASFSPFLVSVNMLLNFTIKYSHHQLHVPLFLKSSFACKKKKQQANREKKVPFKP